MPRKTPLFEAPPYAVEQRLVRLGADLRMARVRRKLTIAEVAEKIGTGVRAVADAEKGKVSTGIAVYVALLWAYGLLDHLADVADPARDVEGQRLALSREKKRARLGKAGGGIDNDF
jgi:transcriptional regulator with XRE-family HTH domain